MASEFSSMSTYSGVNQRELMPCSILKSNALDDVQEVDVGTSAGNRYSNPDQRIEALPIIAEEMPTRFKASAIKCPMKEYGA